MLLHLRSSEPGRYEMIFRHKRAMINLNLIGPVVDYVLGLAEFV
jgi:hypothetical protein